MRSEYRSLSTTLTALFLTIALSKPDLGREAGATPSLQVVFIGEVRGEDASDTVGEKGRDSCGKYLTEDEKGWLLSKEKR
jgi:hypothetical protein